MADRTANRGTAAFSRLETLTGIIALGVLGLLLGLFALLRPAQVVDHPGLDYSHTGRFSYSAESRQDAPYGPEGLSPGEPILSDRVGPVTASFTYELKTDHRTELVGTASFVADVELPQGLSREFTIADRQAFTGRHVTVSGTLPIRAIRNYVDKAQSSFANTTFGSTTVTLRPVIRVEGMLGGQDLEARFVPELPMSLEGTALSIAQGVDAASPGGQTSNPLRAKKETAVEYETIVTNTVPLLLLEPTVAVARGIGFALAGLCLLAGLWVARPLMRSREGANENLRIHTLYGGHIVEVTELSLRGGPVASVATMEALVDLAKKYEAKVMHVAGPDDDSYSVWDNGLVYVYRPADRGTTDSAPGFSKGATNDDLGLTSSSVRVNGSKHASRVDD